MTQPKFQALADRLMKRRLGQINPMENREPLGGSPMAKTRVELHGKQIPLKFKDGDRALEIYHEFDVNSREVEWSFYTDDGEFLLQFGFALEDHRYDVYMVHPGLFDGTEKMGRYLEAIQHNLSQHYPPLTLIRENSGRVEILRTR